MGPIRATALLTRPVDEIREELSAGSRPEFGVEIIEFTDEAGNFTGSMTVTWTLRPSCGDRGGQAQGIQAVAQPSGSIT